MKKILLMILMLSLQAFGQRSLSNPEFTFTDDFESETTNAFWGSGVVTTRAITPDAEANHASKVLRFRYNPDYPEAGSSWSEQRFDIPINATKIEINYDLYVPSNYVHTSGNHKAIVLWSGDYGVTASNISVLSEQWPVTGGATPSIYLGHDGDNQAHTFLNNNAKMWNDNQGSWQSMHIYLELAESEGDSGYFEIYRNGVFLTGTSHPNLIRDQYSDPVIHYSTRGNFIDQGYLMGWANGGFSQITDIYVDNFEIKATTASGAVENNPDSLGYYFNQHGIEFGTLMEVNPLFTDDTIATYKKYYEDNADIITVPCSFYYMCPTARNVFDWGTTTKYLRYADSVGLKTHFTVLPGRMAIPTWLSSGGYSDSTIKVILHDFVDSLFNKVIETSHGNQQIKNLVDEVEVVNEIISPANNLVFDTTFWYKHVPHYWRDMFQWVSEQAAPSCLVGWNENLCEYNDGVFKEGVKYVKAIDTMINDGTTQYIEKIWLQGHLFSDTNSVYKFAKMKEHFTNIRSKLNVPIGISEFDFSIPKSITDKPTNLLIQKKKVVAFIKTCLDLGVDEIIMWGFNDANSWIPNSGYGGEFAFPCLYDSLDKVNDTFVKKDVYYSVINLLKNYNNDFGRFTHVKYGEIKIRVDNTGIADSQSVFLYRLNLHNITDSMFWNRVNSTGTNVKLTDTAGTEILRYIDTIDIANKQGVMNFVYTAYPYPAPPPKFIIKYGEGVTASNDTALFRLAGVVVDLSFKSGRVVNKTGLFPMDSVYNPSGLVWGNNKYGTYLKGSGTSYVCNKSSTNKLAMTQTTAYYVTKYNTAAWQEMLAYASLDANNGITVSMDNGSYGNVNLIRIGGTVTYCYRTEVSLADSVVHFGSFDVGGGTRLLMNDARPYNDVAYSGSFAIPTNGRFYILSGWYGTNRFNGEVNAVTVYNEKKSPEHRSTVYNMIMDTSFFEFSYVPPPVINKGKDTIKLKVTNLVNVQSLQWHKDNVAIENATDSVLQVIVDSTSAAKSVYYCKILRTGESKNVGDWTVERKANSRTVSRRNKYR